MSGLGSLGMYTPARKRRKPSKPYPSFPLTPHNNGQWCKKIRGKVHFFGVWDSPDVALQYYLRIATDLHAGRSPQKTTVLPGQITVKDVCNEYLTYQMRKADAGDISVRWFEDCRRAAACFTRCVGSNRLVEDLGPEDFRRFRQHLLIFENMKNNIGNYKNIDYMYQMLLACYNLIFLHSNVD